MKMTAEIPKKMTASTGDCEIGLALSGSPPLDWAVRKKQVLVVWQDQGVEKSLGQLSPHSRGGHLSLWIGCYEDQLLITFHLPIALRASASKKPRDMYLVVPARALRIGEENATFSAVSPDVVQTALLAGCSRLLHIHFTLSEPSYVVMPKQDYRGAVQGTPLNLLSSLRSLSGASSFDAYINFNSYAQLELQHICNNLCNAALVTPKLDLDRMYGRCGGGLNLWEEQGLRKAINVQRREGTPPPPYEHVNKDHGDVVRAEESKHSIEHTSEHAPPFETDTVHFAPPPSHLPQSGEHLAKAKPEPSVDAQPLNTTEQPFEYCLERISRAGTSHIVFSPTQPGSEKHDEPSCSLASLSDLENLPSCDGSPSQSADHLRNNTDRKTLERTPEPEQPSEQSIEVAASRNTLIDTTRRSISLDRWAHLIRTRHTSPLSEDFSSIAETLLSPVFHPSQFETTDRDESRKRKSPAAPFIRNDKRPCPPPRSTYPCSALTPENLLSEAIHWLFAAWCTCTDVHLVFRDELIALGTAAGRGDPLIFNSARALCSTRLAFRVADGTVPRHNQPFTSAEDSVLEVIEWINAVDREADIIVHDHLVLLAQAARVLERNLSDGQQEAQRSFNLQKASCMMRACYFAGRRTLIGITS